MFSVFKRTPEVEGVKEPETLTREQLWELIPGLKETDSAIEHLMAYANDGDSVSDILTLMERSEKLVARHQPKKEVRQVPVVTKREGLDWSQITCECIKVGGTIAGSIAVMWLVGAINSQGFVDHKAVQTVSNLFRRG